MSETTVGREPIQIVEIQQPLCTNTFGVLPCTAGGGGAYWELEGGSGYWETEAGGLWELQSSVSTALKCYNTRATCQDTANFALGTPLSLYFGKGTVADLGVSDVDYLIPSLVGVSTAPTKINLASSNPDAQGLGNRAICTITFQDHQHSDRVVDPYLTDRTWDPLSSDRGTFWTRWIYRNKYRQNVVIIVYEGYAGQALADMTSRRYFLQSVTPPDASGRVQIMGKDILARIEERKAQAPVASPGVLYTSITDSATSFEVANAVEADYSATGTLRIGDEIMTYTGRATSTNGVTFTGVTRASDGSVAEAHDTDAGVQQCLRYTAQRVDDILEDLLTTYGGIASSYLDTTNWATEFDNYMSFYLITALITEPESVAKLISQVQEQALCYIWWDERDALVKMKAIRGIDSDPQTLTDEANIIADSFAITEKPRERASQVWVYYNQSDFAGNINEPKSYLSQFVIADLDSETDVEYGEASIRTMYGRWIPTDALARNTAGKIITRYVDIPSQCTFQLDAKDRSIWVGDTIRISHWKDVDQYGDRRQRLWTIVSAEEVIPGERVRYLAEDTTLYGAINYILAAGAADYPGAASVSFGDSYIGDADGLLSDGTEAARIT